MNIKLKECGNFYYFQILNTTLTHNFGKYAVIDTILTNELLLESCHFLSNITALRNRPTLHKHKQCILRMTHCCFILGRSDAATKIIDTWEQITLDWVLWETSFQINHYHILSSDRNFTNSTNTIVSGERFIRSISETPYASGKNR